MATPVTKARLRAYLVLKQEIDNQIERLTRMRASLEDASHEGMSEIQHLKYVDDRIGATLARIEKLEKSITFNIAKAKIEEAVIEKAIGLMAYPQEKQILHLKYIDNLSWEEVSEALYGKYRDYNDNLENYNRSMYYLHGRALLHIEVVSGGMN